MPLEGTPRTEIRRRDRGRDDEWIRGFLHRASHGHLAMVQAGCPFINSNLFVYDEVARAVFIHTARTGRTPGLVEAGSAATFATTVIGRMLPAAEALEFSVEYSSVMVFGTVAPVTGPAEKRRVLQLLMDKYAPHLRPGHDYRAITDDELRRTAVHRVDIEDWSGKEKVAPPDFPGAYTLDPLVPPVVP